MLGGIYERCPSYIQNVFVSLYGFFNNIRRYGSKFDEQLLKSLNNDELDASELGNLQRKMLSEFLLHASRSPYWADKFFHYQVNINGNPFDEVKKLPLLTKTEVRDNASKIYIKSSQTRAKTTSGSTGAGLGFWGNSHSDAAQWAVWWRYWQRFGITRGMWCAHFGGKNVVPNTVKHQPFFRINYASNQVMFSAYHLSEHSAKSYIDGLNKHRLVWIHGYPSVIAELARLSIYLGLVLDYKVMCVSLGSENVTSNHDRIITDFFGVKPIQHYGLAEGVANFSNRPGNEGLFVDEDFSFVEFVPYGDQYKIIGTNFTNYSFPLIRYDTSDLVSKVNFNVFPRIVEAIDGRMDDYIQLPSGERIGRVAQVFNNFDFIDESQLIQKSLGYLEVSIVKNYRWHASSELQVLEALRQKLGSELAINFEYVKAVRRTASGKVRFVISEV